MLAMKKVRREFRHRLSVMVGLRFWQRRLRELNVLILMDMASHIYIRSQSEAEKGLMLDVRSAISRREKSELVDILERWDEIQAERGQRRPSD